MTDEGGVTGVGVKSFFTASGKPSRRDVIAHLGHAVTICGADPVSIGTDGGLAALVIDDKAREKQGRETVAMAGQITVAGCYSASAM